MTELERRALLGDREAQEQCTLDNIFLACPKCGDTVHAVIDGDKTTFKCSCGLSFTARDGSPLAEWNTRAAPPVGRCGECKHADNWNEKYANCHMNEGILVEREDFCSSFEPKGGECDG